MKSFASRPSAWFWILSAVLFLTGCLRKETLVESGLRTETLYCSLNRDPGTLDPHIAGGDVTQILNALYEGLVNLANDGATILPGVADRWEISPNGKVYIFHLRAGARWSNGEPITAPGLVDSFFRFLDPRLRSPFVNDLFMIEGAQDYAEGRNPAQASVGLRATDSQTVVFNLAHPCAYFLLRLTEREIRPVFMPSVDHFGGRYQRGAPWDKPGNLVSNGPFMLSEWRQNEVLVVRKNPNYWDAARVRLNEIRFYPSEDSGSAERAYRAGQLHVSAVPPAKRAAYRSQPGSDLHTVMQLGMRYLRFHITAPPFVDARVRRALSLAIDREKLVNGVVAKFGTPAHSIVAPGAGGYQPPGYFRFDAAEAQQLLAAAGYRGGAGFPVAEILVPGQDGETVALAEAIQQMWRHELGIETRIVSNEGTVFLSNLRSGNFQVCLSNWAYDINDPVEQYLLPLSTYPSNETGWGSVAYDEAFARAEVAATKVEREAAFDQMEKILATDMPFSPLFHGANTVLVHPMVRGWRDNGLSSIDWRELWLEAPK